MDISLFDYDLPKRLIAQHPPKRRGESRLMVVNRADGSIEHRMFRDILDYLNHGDGLVVNNTKVFKARLWGHRQTGGRIEVFLIRRVDSHDGDVWEALVSPSRRVDPREKIYFDEKATVELVQQIGEGRWLVAFSSVFARQRIIAAFGHVPLPHYISREDQPEDVRRYQTIFADKSRVGAVAAPTAGFHFSRTLLKKVREMGVEPIELTLHVGPGTFKPVKVQNIEEHTVDPEFAELSETAATAINAVRNSGSRIFVVGTTSVRTLEAAEMMSGCVRPYAGLVNLYIKPGFKFRFTDHLVTNFHLPKSSLLILVSGFAGQELIRHAYHEAVKNDYRFYSYGDAMLIL